MLKRSSLTLFLVPILLVAIQPGRHVQGVVMSPEEAASFSATDTAEASDNAGEEESKQNGNGFLRALKSPFKALGRVFSGGKKSKEESRIQRLSRDDAKRFESAPARIVVDARVTSKEVTDKDGIANTTDYFTHVNKGRDLLNAGNIDGALSELSIAAALEPKSAEAMNYLAIAYETKGLRKRALELFKAAVDGDKANADYLNNYGFLLFRNSNFDEATKQLKRAAKLAPNDARIWNNLGLVQCQRGKFEDAFKSFARATGEFNAHLNIAAQLLAHGYAKAAVRHLEIAQSLEPESIDVLSKLVTLYETTGRAADAETARRSIVALRTFADAKK